MAVSKRKSGGSEPAMPAHKAAKRAKLEATKPVPKDIHAEFETDSDPIIESETGEESGADDGVSWPSDDEGEEYDGEEDVALDNDEKENHAPPSSKPTANGLSTSRESHQKQKAEKNERKMAKPNADIILRSKKIWERLRRQSHVPLEERKKLIAELFDIITGRVKDFVLKHDAGRVIQTALKYGNLSQRKMICKELKGEFAGLAEGKYSKFVIGKLLVHGDDEIRDIIVPEFYGKVRRMIKHPEAAWILDDIYRGGASQAQKHVLLREFYGAEFALFSGKNGKTAAPAPAPTETPNGKKNKPKPKKNDTNPDTTSTLSVILTAYPEKRTPIMRYLLELINQLIQKRTTGFTLLHDAMLQYYLNSTPGSPEATEFIEILKNDEEGDLLKNLAFTASGARIVSLALAYSNAKDRKLLLRAYKSTISLMAYDTNAHLVLLSAMEVVDDTVLTSKTIFSELLPGANASENAETEVVNLAAHITGRIVLNWPFTNKTKGLLIPEGIALLNEIQEIRKTTSRKDAAARKSELAKAALPSLLTVIASRAGDLCTTGFGCGLVSDVLLFSPGEGIDVGPALDALVALCREEVEPTPHFSKLLKALVSGGHFSLAEKRIIPREPRLLFAERLYPVVQEDVLSWVGRFVFVVTAMLETGDLDEKKKSVLKSVLKKNMKIVEGTIKNDAEEGDKKLQERGVVFLKGLLT